MGEQPVVLVCYGLSSFVLDAPGNSGMHSGVRQLTGSMGRYTPPWFSPSRPGCPGTEVSSCCDVSRLYAGSYPALTGRLPLGSFGSSWRSPLMWLLITGLYLKNVYSVVNVHRSEDLVTTRLLQVKFYRRYDRLPWARTDESLIII